MRGAAKTIAGELGERGDGTDPALGQRAAKRLGGGVAAGLARGALIDPGEVGARLLEHLAQDGLELVAARPGNGPGCFVHRAEPTPKRVRPPIDGDL